MHGVGSANLDTRLLRYRGSGRDENVVALAEDLLSAGRTDDAQEVVRRSLEANPTDGQLLLLDGRTRMASGDLLGAQASLLKAARALPKSKGPFRWLGEVLLKRDDPARAAKVLERARAIDETDRAVQLLLDRARRLQRSDAAPRPSAQPAPSTESSHPRFSEAPEERTVIRRDLTEELRTLSRQEKAKPAPAPSAPAPASAGASRATSFDDPFEDAQTNVAPSSDDVKATIDALRRGDPGAAKARVDRTLGFGGGQRLPPPPRQPLISPHQAAPSSPAAQPPAPSPAPSAPPLGTPEPPAQRARPFTFDEEPTSVQPPHTATSPGAAKAPAPPPPKRRLPSQARAQDEAEQVDVPGRPPGQPSPWDGLSQETELESEELEDLGIDSDEINRDEGDLVELPPPAYRAPDVKDPFAPPSALAPVAVPLAPEPSAAPARPTDSLPAELYAPEALIAEPAAVDAVSDGTPALADAVEASRAPDLDPARQGAEDVDEILHMLKREGLFEPPSGEGAAWAKRAEVKATQASGTRTGLWIGVVWLLGVGIVVGGYFGWEAWLEHRHVQAAELLATATQEAYNGDHADLIDAERHLREARDLHPQDPSISTLMLFVHSQRALEDGAFATGFIRPAMARVEAADDDDAAAYLAAARAVVATGDGHQDQAREQTALALSTRPDDPAILYLVGRLEQRLGMEDALTHLEAASVGEAALSAPRIALAEAKNDAGQAEEALSWLDQVLEHDGQHLRAQLWRSFLTADDGEPDELLAAVEEIASTLEDHGAPTDEVIYHLTRARLLRRQGHTEQAGEAVDEALSAGATEPRLLATVAIEGRRAGRMLQAEHAARTAVAGAPSNPDFRKLLAEIQLARRNGRAALATLADLSADDPDVLEMRAQAALLLGTQEALDAAAQGLDAYVEAAEEPSVGARALRIRVHVRRGNAEPMMAVARELVSAAPGDPAASLALGEAALRTHHGDVAVEALTTVVSASPNDAEGHYLLGRARRMAADGEGARSSFERAIELTPEHAEAKLALGGLLLDLGDYEAAETLYAGLARSGRSAGGRAVAVAGRLGRVEALIGLNRLDDAQVQLEGLREDARETPTARLVAARLRLRQGQAGAALERIRELATGDGASASVLALYGDALLAARQAEPAAEAYAAAVEADSGSPEGLLGRAEMAVRSEREGDAVELLDRVRRSLDRRLRPPAMHARMHTLYGRAYLLAGRSDAGRRELQQACEVEGAPPEAHFFLGEALSGEDSAAARAAYERYLELAPEGAFAARARRAIR